MVKSRFSETERTAVQNVREQNIFTAFDSKKEGVKRGRPKGQKLRATWTIDYCTLVGPKKSVDGLLEIIECLGFDGNVDEATPPKGYTRGISFGGWALLGLGGPTFSSYWCFKISGMGCQYLTAERVRQYMRDAFALPGDVSPEGKTAKTHCTRLDLACDLRGSLCQSFIKKALLSCKRGEMVRLRKYNEVKSVVAGEVTGHTLYCGSRQSDKYLRIYDKGLESGSAKKGEWIRWEAEYKKGLANKVVQSLLSEVDHSFSYSHWACAVVEFKNKRTFAHPRWYTEFLDAALWDGEVRRMESIPVPKDFTRYRNWLLESAVHGALGRVATELGEGLTPGMVLDIVCGTGRWNGKRGVDDRNPVHASIVKMVSEYLEATHEEMRMDW